MRPMQTSATNRMENKHKRGKNGLRVSSTLSRAASCIREIMSSEGPMRVTAPYFALFHVSPKPTHAVVLPRHNQGVQEFSRNSSRRRRRGQTKTGSEELHTGDGASASPGCRPRPCACRPRDFRHSPPATHTHV